MPSYKLLEHRYTFKGNFAYAADCIRHSLDMMGYTESETEEADLYVYNHTARDLEPDMPESSIIFKPTAPTSKHFQIDTLGYANSSSITFNKPIGNGIITAYNMKQAIQRSKSAASKKQNKGSEAANAVMSILQNGPKKI